MVSGRIVKIKILKLHENLLYIATALSINWDSVKVKFINFYPNDLGANVKYNRH